MKKSVDHLVALFVIELEEPIVGACRRIRAEQVRAIRAEVEILPRCPSIFNDKHARCRLRQRPNGVVVVGRVRELYALGRVLSCVVRQLPAFVHHILPRRGILHRETRALDREHPPGIFGHRLQIRGIIEKCCGVVLLSEHNTSVVISLAGDAVFRAVFDGRDGLRNHRQA